MPCVLIASDPPVDGEPLQHHDPPGVVDARDQLAHPDATELPVGELRWRIGGAFSPLVTLNTVRSNTAS